MKKYIQPRTEEINFFTENMLALSGDPTKQTTNNVNWTEKKEQDGGMFGSSNYWGDNE